MEEHKCQLIYNHATKNELW